MRIWTKAELSKNSVLFKLLMQLRDHLEIPFTEPERITVALMGQKDFLQLMADYSNLVAFRDALRDNDVWWKIYPTLVLETLAFLNECIAAVEAEIDAR